MGAEVVFVRLFLPCPRVLVLSLLPSAIFLKSDRESLPVTGSSHETPSRSICAHSTR